MPRSLLVAIVAAALLVPISGLSSSTDIVSNTGLYMQAMASRRHFSGVVVIARGGKVLFAKPYGMANYEDGTPNTMQTKFRIGSMTKQFTAMAVMVLQEHGKLFVDDSVCKYVEPCPAAWQPVTIRHLLTHTSGIPNYTTFADIREMKRQGITPEGLISEIESKPLDFTPGDKFAYSNSGYVVLGCVIQKVSGETYAEFMRKNIFDPLGMKDTGYETARAIVPHRAAGYEWSKHALENADFVDISVAFSAGALYSTAEDLLRWDAALYTDKVISQKSLDAMFTPFKSNAASGWFVDTDKQGRKWLVHDGGIDGFRSFIARYPTDHTLILILSNLGNTNVDDMIQNLTAIIFGESYELPKEYRFVTVPADVLQQYVGTYRLPWGSLLFITTKDGRLYVAGKNQDASEIDPISTAKFYLEDEDQEFEFVKDASGKVSSLMFGRFEAKREPGR